MGGRKKAATKSAKGSRAGSRKVPARKKSAARRSPATVDARLAALEASVAGITAVLPELARGADLALLMELLQDFPEQATSEPGAAPRQRGGGLAAVEKLVRALREAVAEIPRPADFELLADHLYAFAKSAPDLLASLDAVPKATARVEKAVASLRESSETLRHVQEGFAESLIRLPRPEDYEPLVGPLAEFARVAPSLASSLSDVLKVAKPLATATDELRGVTRSLRVLHGEMRERAAGGSQPAAGGRRAAELAAEAERAAEAIHAALDGLPRDREYARFASQLRELASVSPSLLEWLDQVGQLSQPLAESVAGLRRAAGQLQAASAAAMEEGAAGSGGVAARTAALAGEIEQLRARLSDRRGELDAADREALDGLSDAAQQLSRALDRAKGRKRAKD